MAAEKEEDARTFILDATRCLCEPALEEAAFPPPLLRAGTAAAPDPRHAAHLGYLPLKLTALKVEPQAEQAREGIESAATEVLPMKTVDA